MVALVEKGTWELVKDDYEAGRYKTLKELAQRHGINQHTLRSRVFNEKWKSQLESRLNEVKQKVTEVKVDLASQYLERTYKRSLKYEKIIDLSQQQQSSSNDGTPLLDVDAIVAYSKAELNIHALAKSALRISDKLDVTSGGVDLGTSFVSAISKMRNDASLPRLTSSDLQDVMNAEIVE